MIQKLIVTNRSVLKKKYGQAGWMAISKALTRLATADVLRGLTTHLECVDAPSKSVPKVRTASSAKQVKMTIDALYRAYGAPDYLMILGAPDVIPFQRLENPLAGGDDTDSDLPSDLPYACEESYSKDIATFVGPTRVVGRLSDVRGNKSAKELIALIDSATTFDGTPGKKAFVISADEWKGATKANAKLAFGTSQIVGLCPPSGPGWKPPSLKAPLHFINCHGADTDPNYYGSSPEYPEAHLPSNLAGIVTPGSVVVAECCFGAELYDPTAATPVGIANTYLLEGAAAFCGSTNTAYGESTAKDRCAADILCTDFMAAILAKATTGRALLQARQAYVKAAGSDGLDPVDLKTLGQFLLLGDPSLRPFGVPPKANTVTGLSKTVLKVIKPKPAAKAPSKELSPSAHKKRRRKLRAEGTKMARTTLRAVKVPAAPKTDSDPLRKLLDRENVDPTAAMRFVMVSPRRTPSTKTKTNGGAKSMYLPTGKRALDANGHPTIVHVVFSKTRVGASAKTTGARAGARAEASIESSREMPRRPLIKSVQALIARTRNGQVLSYKTVSSK